MRRNDVDRINDKTNITCVGFIMDGNRRWAEAQNLPTLEGHKRGHQVFKEYVQYVCDFGIPHAVFYAFSTENWNRSKEEVAYLMELFKLVLTEIMNEFTDLRARVRIVGRRSDFSPDIQTLMHAVENKSAEFDGTTIWIALSYGGRAEIVAAVNRAVQQGEAVTEDSFSELLWTAGMPDPDIIVRTGSEKRLSNFLPWQSVYSELLFLDKYWPALTRADFEGILLEYAKRERRQGV